jgi:hypothetical protein
MAVVEVGTVEVQQPVSITRKKNRLVGVGRFMG